MKLFLKRESADGEVGFSVMSESAVQLYTVLVHTEKTKQRIRIIDGQGNTVSDIVRKELVLQYFTVRCCGRIFVLVPYNNECFMFMIYGSTYRFAGDLSSGCFSLIDVDKSPVMTQKKCWSKFGDGFELKIYDEEQTPFAISCALCAAMYLLANEADPIPL